MIGIVSSLIISCVKVDDTDLPLNCLELIPFHVPYIVMYVKHWNKNVYFTADETQTDWEGADVKDKGKISNKYIQISTIRIKCIFSFKPF